MKQEIYKNIKIIIGILILICSIFGFVYAIGFHTADEILSGTFIGSFDFSNANIQGLEIVNTTYVLGEVNTGKKWIDGKPIYRSIFNGTSNGGRFDTGIAIEKIIDCGGYLKVSTDIIAFGWYDSSSARFVPYVWADGNLNIMTDGYGGWYYEAWIEYTKP